MRVVTCRYVDGLREGLVLLMEGGYEDDGEICCSRGISVCLSRSFLRELSRQLLMIMGEVLLCR